MMKQYYDKLSWHLRMSRGKMCRGNYLAEFSVRNVQGKCQGICVGGNFSGGEDLSEWECP